MQKMEAVLIGVHLKKENNLEELKLYNGDCLEVMDKLIAEGVKVDAIITDPPYNTTLCHWDKAIDFGPMWERLKAIRSGNCPIILFAQEPFASALRMSNSIEYKYDWVWVKNRAANFMMAKYVPLKTTEQICVFSDCGVNTNCKKKMNYYPQGLKKCNKVIRSNIKKEGINRYNCLSGEHKQEFTGYPTNLLQFDSETGLHPTQKPISLMEYLVKTYTKETDTVLDFTMGSGTTGVACKNLNRNFIGIELDKKYFDVAKQRIENTGGLF